MKCIVFYPKFWGKKNAVGLDGLGGVLLNMKLMLIQNGNWSIIILIIKCSIFFKKEYSDGLLRNQTTLRLLRNYSMILQKNKLHKSLLYKTEGIKDLLTISRLEPLNKSLAKENTDAWTFSISNISTQCHNIEVKIKGFTVLLNIYDTYLTRKEIFIGERSIKTVHKQ